MIAKLVACPTCGSPAGRACQQLRPDHIRVVPTHWARKKAYANMPAEWIVMIAYKADQRKGKRRMSGKHLKGLRP